MRDVEIQNRKPISGAGHSAPHPNLQHLSDLELLNAVRYPQNNDYLTENTRTGIMVDGNGRAHELMRRATDTNSSFTPEMTVPVAPYTPDLSMFPDLD